MGTKDGKIRWGIVATGWIAEKFVAACDFESKRTGTSRVVAVASRDSMKASLFAGKWDIPKSYGSYEELFADPDIDAVYIATPHHLHASLSVAALEAGKHVLCEKPVSLTSSEFAPVVEVARRSGKFFMEAMWMKFNPSFLKALEWIAEGRIGNVKFIRSDFFLDAPFDPASRYYNPALGGGALLDLGIYPVTFAAMMAGRSKPETVSSIIHTGPTGVDVYDKARLVWDTGVAADLSCAINLLPLGEMRAGLVIGETGAILLPYFWMANEAVLLDTNGKQIDVFKGPFACNGYEYEIREVERCLARGLAESPVQTWADSIMVMDILDTIRMVAKDE